MPSFTVISISVEEDPQLLFFNMYVFCIINIDNLHFKSDLLTPVQGIIWVQECVSFSCQ